jgi:hypothetical protein
MTCVPPRSTVTAFSAALHALKFKLGLLGAGLYGDGFYYIPGTDTCLKLGGQELALGWHEAGHYFVARECGLAVIVASTRPPSPRRPV